MSDMNLKQSGMLNVLLLPVVFLSLLLIGTIIFAFWAYSNMLTYKNNADQKIDAAVLQAKQATEANDSAQYAQEQKQPLATFVGPSTFGGVTVKYPKTWSAY